MAEEFGHVCELAFSFSKGRVTHEPCINACETRLERKAREQGQVSGSTIGGITEAAGNLNKEDERLGDVSTTADERADNTHLHLPDPDIT